MSIVKQALIKSRAWTENAATSLLSLKGGSIAGLSVGDFGYGQFTQFQQQGANRQRYGQYRGWVHSAINALAMEASRQSFQVGKKLGKTTKKKPNNRKHLEFLDFLKAPSDIQTKAAAEELEIISGHKLYALLEKPNPIQHTFQFVYSFVANICLTGWTFVVAGESEDGSRVEFFSVPTTWVHPDHTEGPFSKFRIINPNDPTNGFKSEPLDRSQVSFSYFPNPADPMAALSLTQAQQMGISIDDHIQTSQKVFFENGVFPSVVVTVGSQPHPDVPGGIRPRLTAVQRRQVYAAIKKVSAGVANYGNPAIVDGLIEKIERLSATQNEMGWEKSEKSVRTRILSAFGVHPFILGEEASGSYAQAYNVQDIFCRRVNALLKLLGHVMTELGSSMMKEDLVVWWDEAKARDPQMEQTLWNAARARGDVSQNEFRKWMGLAPDEDHNEAHLDKGMLQGITTLMEKVKGGAIAVEQAVAFLEGLGVPSKLAKKIAGEGPQPGDVGPDGQPLGGVPGQTSDQEAPQEDPFAAFGSSESDFQTFGGLGEPDEMETIRNIGTLIEKTERFLKVPTHQEVDRILEAV